MTYYFACMQYDGQKTQHLSAYHYPDERVQCMMQVFPSCIIQYCEYPQLAVMACLVLTNVLTL